MESSLTKSLSILFAHGILIAKKFQLRFLLVGLLFNSIVTTCMSCYGFFSVTVPRMYPFNPRLNFRVAYCLKLSGNWTLLYMKKVTKWQLKSRKLRTIVCTLIPIENLLNHPEGLYASSSSHCDRHTKILIHYKNTDKWAILRNGRREGSKT